MTSPRIAIPLPLSTDPDYVKRSLPQYQYAVTMSGGEPIIVPLDLDEAETNRIIESCQGVLLPGSKTDVDPARYGGLSHEEVAPADRKREAVDYLLLEHAYTQRKPILGICYGLQSLNVYRQGTLIEHIPDFLSPNRRHVNHAAGRMIALVHQVRIDAGSMLARIVAQEGLQPEAVAIGVNSSHHQAINRVGGGLKIVARCPDDSIVEALEGTDPEHFVLAVQWHPERSVDADEASRSIFRALIEGARTCCE